MIFMNDSVDLFLCINSVIQAIIYFCFMQEKPYRLDRSSVIPMTFEEAGDHMNYWVNKTEDERLNAACFLINQIFGVSAQTRVDRTTLDKRKQP
jgi:hypothetical protein